MSKRFKAILMLVFFILGLIIPGTNAQAMTSTEKGVINKDYVELDLGASFKLKINKVSYKNIKFSTSDKNIATVDKNGTITAVSEGFVKITANYNKKDQICEVAVFDSNKRSQVIGAGKYIEGEDILAGDYLIKLSTTDWIDVYDENNERIINECINPNTQYTVHIREGYTLILGTQSIISETRKITLKNNAKTVTLSDSKWNDIGAGQFKEGIDIAKGNYLIQLSNTGWISVYNENNERIINECINANTQYTVHIREGYTLVLGIQGKIKLAPKLK